MERFFGARFLCGTKSGIMLLISIAQKFILCQIHKVRLLLLSLRVIEIPTSFEYSKIVLTNWLNHDWTILSPGFSWDILRMNQIKHSSTVYDTHEGSNLGEWNLFGEVDFKIAADQTQEEHQKKKCQPREPRRLTSNFDLQCTIFFLQFEKLCLKARCARCLVSVADCPRRFWQTQNRILLRQISHLLSSPRFTNQKSMWNST